MTTSTQTDSTKHLTLVYRITSPAQQTRLLAEGQWVASAHSDVLAERDALQRRVDSMEQKIELLQRRVKNVNDYHQAWAAHAQELEKQLDAVGAGGVEPLRRAKCLHQIEEPQPAAKFGGWIFLRDDVRDIIDVTEPNGTRHALTKSILAKHKQIVGLFEAMRRGLLRQPAPQPPAVAQELPYKDSTPKLSVGNSSFESWFSGYSPMHKGDKQRARDAYAAGMGDPLVTTAAPVLAALHDAEAALELACARLPEKGGIYPDALAITSEHKAWQSVRAAIALMQANPVEIQQIAAQASLGQPVAWRYIPGAWKSAVLTDDPEQAKLAAEAGVPVTPLYAAPQPPAPVRHPLTNEQITKAFNEAMRQRQKEASNAETNRLFVRAIEAAHGITAPKPLWLPSDDTEGGAV